MNIGVHISLSILVKPPEILKCSKCLGYSWVPWMAPEIMLIKRLMVDPQIELGWGLVMQERPIVY